MSSKAVETFKAERKKIKQKEAEKKKKFKENFGRNFVAITKAFFHTIFLIAITYFVVLFGTINIPNILAYILGGLGFGAANATGSEFIVSLMAGFFLTGWIFLISFIILRFAFRIYVRNIKLAFPDEWVEAIEKIFPTK